MSTWDFETTSRKWNLTSRPLETVFYPDFNDMYWLQPEFAWGLHYDYSMHYNWGRGKGGEEKRREVRRAGEKEGEHEWELR